jgi:hypothetical protein
MNPKKLVGILALSEQGGNEFRPLTTKAHEQPKRGHEKLC